MTEKERVFCENYGSKIGMCKWFNHKLGYGFITTIIDGEEHDIFAHQTNLKPKKSTYRTLSTGEYVSFNMSKSGEARQAIDITGILGGPLKCDFQIKSRNKKSDNDNQELDVSQLEDV